MFRRLVLALQSLFLATLLACAAATTPTAVPSPTATATPLARVLPSATATPIATATPTAIPATATSTPLPPTPTPTRFVPTVIVIPTPTPLPSPTPTPLPPTPTPTPSYPFAVERVVRVPNCGMTAIEGQVLGPAGELLEGYFVLVGSSPGPYWTIGGPTDGEGFYRVVLADEPKEARWYVYVVGANHVQRSPAVFVQTTSWGCLPGDPGNQTPQVVFKSVGPPPPKEYVARVPPGDDEFWMEYHWAEPNCSRTKVVGYVRDVHGNGMGGKVVVIGSNEGPWQAQGTTAGDGSYGFLLDPNGPKAGKWYVYVATDDGETRISDRVDLETTAADCAPGGQGRQTVHVEFRRRW